MNSSWSAETREYTTNLRADLGFKWRNAIPNLIHPGHISWIAGIAHWLRETQNLKIRLERR